MTPTVVAEEVVDIKYIGTDHHQRVDMLMKSSKAVKLFAQSIHPIGAIRRMDKMTLNK